LGLILHCAPRVDWEAAVALGAYRAPSLAESGFIHFSTPEQLLAVVNAMFRGQSGLVLLCVESERLSAELRHENLEGGTTLYPHVYGPVELDAVNQVLEFPPQADGTFLLPPGIRGAGGPPFPNSVHPNVERICPSDGLAS
jgi:uncharacterized protein (DUF952 family)